jgi:hypothetical protein
VPSVAVTNFTLNGDSTMNGSPYKLLAAAAAIAYAVSGATVLGHHIPDAHWGTRGAIVDTAGAFAFALTALALPGLARALAIGRLASWATRAAQLGLAGMTVESVASLIHGGNTLGVLFLAGLLLTLVGLTGLAVAGMRSGQLRWAAPLPPLGLLVGIAGGDHGGFLATAAVWLTLAIAIDVRRTTPLVPAVVDLDAKVES